MKKALITGISGQDGSYLAELLFQKNYHVVGLRRRASSDKAENLERLAGKIQIVSGNFWENSCFTEMMETHQPDEVYHLASHSHLEESTRHSIETGEITGLGAHRVFEAVRLVKPDARVFQACSSQMFGEVENGAQNENTPFRPITPYGAAKLYAYTMAHIYRKSYGLFISCGILFNHESPRRGMSFVTQKITYGAACLKLGIKNSSIINELGEPIVHHGTIALGNLDAKKDWGFAGDYVEAMWLMLQQEMPDNFVIGTGELRTVKDFCQAAFSYVGLDWRDYVKVDARFLRSLETNPLLADASKAKRLLGWKPKTSFNEMVATMVEHHLRNLKQERSR